MTEITETALVAVYMRGHREGREEMWGELRAGKAWWVMYPYAIMFGLLVGMLIGMGITLFLTRGMCG